MDKPIKLPAVPAGRWITDAGRERHVFFGDELEAYARLAVEQNTAELRAERDALRAELDRLTTLDVTLDEKTVRFLSHLIDATDDEFPEVRLTSGNGHSGFGLYVSFAEYPEEGSELLTPLPKVKEAKS